MQIRQSVAAGTAVEETAWDGPTRATGAADAEIHGAMTYRERVDAYKRQIILEALDRTGQNNTRAARLLGLERTFLIFLMHRHGIPVREPLGARRTA